MNSTEILNSLQVSLTLRRLCFQLIENHDDFTDTVIVGLQPNGIYLANRIRKELELITNQSVITGALDITFFRDDFRRKKGILTPHETNISFNIENCNVIVIDDVLYTGRTTRSAFDALGSFGRANFN